MNSDTNHEVTPARIMQTGMPFWSAKALNMLIETRHGFDFIGADFNAWARKAGFSRTEVMPLAGPTSAAIVCK